MRKDVMALPQKPKKNNLLLSDSYFTLFRPKRKDVAPEFEIIVLLN